MTERRFFSAHSHVYGYCVYDRERGCAPAYDACDQLPREYLDDGTQMAPACVLLPDALVAARLSSLLNSYLQLGLLDC